MKNKFRKEFSSALEELNINSSSLTNFQFKSLLLKLGFSSFNSIETEDKLIIDSLWKEIAKEEINNIKVEDLKKYLMIILKIFDNVETRKNQFINNYKRSLDAKGANISSNEKILIVHQNNEKNVFLNDNSNEGNPLYFKSFLDNEEEIIRIQKKYRSLYFNKMNYIPSCMISINSIRENDNLSRVSQKFVNNNNLNFRKDKEFKERGSSNKRSSTKSPSKKSNVLSLISNIITEQKIKKEFNLHQLKHEEDAKILKECTFQPKLVKQSSKKASKFSECSDSFLLIKFDAFLEECFTSFGLKVHSFNIFASSSCLS